LTFGLAVHRPLRAPTEDDERHQRAQHYAEQDHRDHRESAGEHAERHRHGNDQQERADHVGQEALVFFALHIERLPELGTALFGGRLASSFRLGSGGFGRLGAAGFSHNRQEYGRRVQPGCAVGVWCCRRLAWL
jgi:hypothetical protein